MRGHVRKRGGTWSVVVDVGRDPETGKRKQRWHSGFRTRKEAEQGLSEILSRLARGGYVAPSRTGTGDYLRDWLQSIRTRVRSSTWESYSRNAEIHIIPRLGLIPIQALSSATLNRFYADLLAGGRRDGSGGLSPRTVRYCHTIIRKALADAVRWNLLPRNVADAADPPSPRMTKAPGVKTWNADELRHFLLHVRGNRLYALWLLAATTGMRRGEIAGLRWRNVDLTAQRVAVVQTLVTVGYDIEWSEPKTDRGRRSVALDSATVAALQAHQLRQFDEQQLLGHAEPQPDLVFTREDGTLLHPERISKMFDRHVEQTGLPRIRFHDLRHTHATLALQAGVHPKVVSERLGHADIALTLNVYSHAIPALQETAAALVAALVLDE
jgi:integrase